VTCKWRLPATNLPHRCGADTVHARPKCHWIDCSSDKRYINSAYQAHQLSTGAAHHWPTRSVGARGLLLRHAPDGSKSNKMPRKGQFRQMKVTSKL
jgi:hypothetical protein